MRRRKTFVAGVPRLTLAEKSLTNESMKYPNQAGFAGALFLALLGGVTISAPAADDMPAWPAITAQTRPWAFWWWMGSAVDKENLTRELTRYHDAGWGGVHIIPIYGAKGWEAKFIAYLSPQWMEMLKHTVTEARRLGLGVDMTTGTGWCFGGPQVTDKDANASVVVTRWVGSVPRPARWSDRNDPTRVGNYGGARVRRMAIRSLYERSYLCSEVTRWLLSTYGLLERATASGKASFMRDILARYCHRVCVKSI